jgi:NADH-quinone oxidoreductase subunit M
MPYVGHVLSVIIFFPLIASLAILLLNRDDHRWLRFLAFGSSIAEFLLSLFVLPAMWRGAPGYHLEEFVHWMDSPPINYHVGMDGISLFLVLLTTFLTPLALLASWNSILGRVKEFVVMLLVLEAGVIGVFLSLDLFLFFLFWETMLLPMYFLIGIWGHERRVYAAVKFILYTMAGSSFLLVGILWLYRVSGTFDLPAIQQKIQDGIISLPPGTELLLFLSFFLAFAVKVPLFPLHTWLPDAHVEAPTAGSVDLAAILLKTGTYGMIRFCLPLFPNASRHAAPYVATLAIIGIIYGALVSLVQPNLKKVVAYSSVSHLGFVVLGIFAFQPIAMQGAVFQMLAHGVSTAGLFLGVGMIYDRRHTYEMSEFGGLATPMPHFAAFFLLITLSSLGLPLLNGFVGEYLILLGTFIAHWKWAVLGSTGVILSAAYLLWAYQRVLFGEITVEKNRTLPDISRRERFILATIGITVIWMGVFSPFFTRRFAASCQTVLEQMQPHHAFEAATPAAPALPSGSLAVPTLKPSAAPARTAN